MTIKKLHNRKIRDRFLHILKYIFNLSRFSYFRIFPNVPIDKRNILIIT